MYMFTIGYVICNILAASWCVNCGTCIYVDITKLQIILF